MTILSRGKRVVLIGDSHMEALGPRLRRRLPAAAGVVIQHIEPQRGWSARRYVRSGIVPGLTRGADVVIFELGGNDASANIQPETHARDIATLMGQAAPAKVIWVGPGVTLRPDLEVARGPLRATQARVVPQLGGAWLDAQPMTRTSDLRSDQVHFSRDGYTRWADLLAPALAQVRIGQSGAVGRTVRRWVGPVILVGSAAAAVTMFLWSRRR